MRARAAVARGAHVVCALRLPPLLHQALQHGVRRVCRALSSSTHAGADGAALELELRARGLVQDASPSLALTLSSSSGDAHRSAAAAGAAAAGAAAAAAGAAAAAAGAAAAAAGAGALSRHHMRAGAYAGFDATAASLHVGHLCVASALRLLGERGVPVVAVVGGATARVGDPSGRSAERPLLEDEASAAYARAIGTQLRTLLPHARVVDNLEWWQHVDMLGFLKRTGRFMRVSSMLARDCVKSRLDQPGGGLSFAEFAYQAMQAHDFVHLRDAAGVRIQVGGSDQWGNIAAGLDLAERVGSAAGAPGAAAPMAGFTVPLLTIGGKKMGKSAGNAVWLDAQLTTPYAMYQYLLGVPDADVRRLLCALTLEPLDRVAAACDKTPGASEWAAQQLLASSVTDWVHGARARAAVQDASRKLFAAPPERNSAEEQHLVDAIELAGVPGASVPVDELLSRELAHVAVDVGLCESRSAARRLASAGGLHVNGMPRGAADRLASADLLQGRLAILRSGRKTVRIAYALSS